MESSEAKKLNKQYTNPPYPLSVSQHFTCSDGIRLAPYILWTSSTIDQFIEFAGGIGLTIVKK